ncbi:UNVERIFIED_ORG: hypothetical protein GGR78_000194 [Xanthomonas campestris]
MTLQDIHEYIVGILIFFAITWLIRADMRDRKKAR